MTRKRPFTVFLASLFLLAITGASPALADSQPTGLVRWVTTLGGGAVSAPVLGKDLVYAGTGDGRLAALDPGTGAIAWVTDLAAVTGTAGAVSAPALGKGLVFAGTSDGHLAALA